ncbi:MAG: hypothetical protein ABSC94_30470 [Polyangiaceae bacterium]|jgi:hypothetical protein
MGVLPAISDSDVRSAVRRIDKDGVPPGRGSTKFCLVFEGCHYPPKYVLALAARNAVGRDLLPDEFSGGEQTNGLFRAIGFEVARCSCRGSRHDRRKRPTPDRAKAPPKPATPRAATEAETTIVRVVTNGRTPDRPSAEERILLDVFGAHWPTGIRAKFVQTPGGFVRGEWPQVWNGRVGWDSRKEDAYPLFANAERQLASVVTERVCRAAAGKAEVLTVGIDLFGGQAGAHAELVAVFDIAKRTIVRWTGKSYPTPNQERTLVQVVDLDSHFLEIARERALVLGCHDLNMYSPRGHANQSPDGLRRAKCDEMKARITLFKPTVVLQHPHSTDTPNIWRLPWLRLAREVPSARVWASGVAYFNWNGPPRAELSRVLEQTKIAGREVSDIVIDAWSYA